MTLSEASGNHCEVAPLHGGVLPPGDESTMMSTPSDQGGADQQILNFGSNMWDFETLGFLDDAPLWNMTGGFLMNEIELNGTPSQMHDLPVNHDPGIRDSSNGMQIGHDDPSVQSGSKEPTVIDMRDIWFTKIKREDHSVDCAPSIVRRRTSISRSVTSPSEPELVDEDCRRELSKALTHPPPQEDLLPSSRFLNLSIRRYLKCFHPILPIIHAATFQPSTENRLLVISIASVGSLFLGSTSAVKRGRRIFEGLNKVILMSDKFIGHTSNQSDPMMAMIQAAMIGQTFAVLSGDARHLAIFDSYHASLISFARREGIFEARPEMNFPESSSDEDLECAWREWARQEQRRRIVLALHIHDAELSFLYHRDSLLKHRRSENETLKTSPAFNATTAREWETCFKTEEDFQCITGVSHRHHSVDKFALYIKLEAIGVLIAEDRRQGCLETSSKTYEDSLLRWYESFTRYQQVDQSDELSLIPLWHWTFMNLLVDLDKLESAIGRDGPDRGYQALEYVTTWASTKVAGRCMMHAFMLQKRLEASKFDGTPAIHVPRITFAAAIVSYIFVTYGPGNDPQNGLSNLFDTTAPEFRVLGADVKQLAYISRLTWNRNEASSVTAATLCVLNGLLERMSVWGLAGRFADILAHLIDGEV